jgi:hypothetical protein
MGNENLIDHPESIINRFWKYVDKKSDNECWEWKGSLMKRGNYGQLRYKFKTLKSHRISFEIHYGKIEVGKHICHKCGNSKCCNPNHLYEGTPKENWHDAIKHNTAHKLPRIDPEKVHCAKLNFEIANEIRKSNEKGVIIARKFNISPTMISRIRKNLAWII